MTEIVRVVQGEVWNSCQARFESLRISVEDCRVPPKKFPCLVNAGPTSSTFKHLWCLIEETVFRLCWSSYCEEVCLLDSLPLKAEGQQNLYRFGFPILIGPVPSGVPQGSTAPTPGQKTFIVRVATSKLTTLKPLLISGQGTPPPEWIQIDCCDCLKGPNPQ